MKKHRIVLKLVKMSSEKWWKASCVYQIYPRSFKDSNEDGIGDLKGITSKLDYIKKLGVDVIWISPYFKSPNCDNGYDISDYRDIMPDFGTMDDWEEMLREMHKRNLKLVMDLVVNHTSDKHEWFIESRKSIDNEKRDYYIWRKGKENGAPPNNWTSFFSGPAWKYDETTNEYYLHLFAEGQPDLNWENDNVREEVYDIMKFWLDKGIDGFRMDVISLISKKQGLPDGCENGSLLIGTENYAHGPREHEFLQEMNKKVLSKYDIMTVGETAFVTPEEAIKYTDPKRNELNMVFQFELMGVDNENDKWFIKPWKLSEFKKIQTKWQIQLNGKGWNSLYLNNHDQPRCVSRFGNDSDEFRKISAKMLATMNHTLQGTPFIYQGEEIGMTNVKFDDINDYKDVEIHNLWKEYVLSGKLDATKIMNAIHYMGRDNARTPMQWDSTENAGFTKGSPWIKVNPNYKSINVEESLNDPDSIFYYYQKLIQLRHQYKVIVYGDYKIYDPEDENLYIYTREYNNELLFVALNFKNNTFPLIIPNGIDLANARLLISNYNNNDTVPHQLRPYEAVVYIVQKK